jgi:pyruvate dehydrogenase E1 component alpha subunit
METLQNMNENGELANGYAPEVAEEVMIDAYKAMRLARHVDERMITLQRQGTITFALSSLGEECCSVGAAAALDPGDWIYPQYRENGALFYRGFSAEDYVHHMFGDAKDLGKGRQMPNHFGCRELNVVTVSSPIGTKIPHAAGCAYAMKLQNEALAALVFFGEGATSEGDFHAGMNFAAVLEAPAIFFCRNNQYAISTKESSQYHSEGVAPKGAGYGIETYRVDGNDFFAVYDSVAKARNHCVEGKGPVLIEAMTYRRGAHSTSDDPTRYRPKEEVEEWEKKDPVIRLRRYMENAGLWDGGKEKSLLQEIENEVTKAIEIAKKTEKPPLISLVEDVYEEIPATLMEQYEDVRQHHTSS